MFEQYKHIHFVGIGGVGMSALAYILLKRGFTVSGSDLQFGRMTRRLAADGAIIYLGQDACQIEGADAVVVSTAINRDNPELMAAKFKNIPVLHRSDVLAELLNAEDAEGTAVAGAHGKTTTSAMLSVIAEIAGLNPTIVIGGEVSLLEGNSRNGGNLVVAEADESDGSFLKFHPFIPVITNIEDDHLDYYGTEENIFSAFKQYLSNIKKGGTAVLCIDNPKVRELAESCDVKHVTYGFSEDSDFRAANVEHSVQGTVYDIYHKGEKLVTIKLQVPGDHNVLNSLGAFATAVLWGLDAEVIADALAAFPGVGRRFETIGREKDIWVVDDYAHHPTEIGVTLKAAGQTGAKRVICVFQAHRYTRTKILFNEFCKCFKECDELIITHIYSAGEDSIPGIDGAALARGISETTGQKVRFIDGFDSVEEYLLNHVEAGDLVLTVGAGDVYKVAEELVSDLRETDELIRDLQEADALGANLKEVND